MHGVVAPAYHFFTLKRHFFWNCSHPIGNTCGAQHILRDVMMSFKFKIWKWSLQSFFWIEDLLLHETIFLRVLNNARACQDFEFFSLKSELFSSTEERKARNCQLLRKESEVFADFFGCKFKNIFPTSLANTLFHNIYLPIHASIMLRIASEASEKNWQFHFSVNFTTPGENLRGGKYPSPWTKTHFSTLGL